jgi:hypothetical protein
MNGAPLESAALASAIVRDTPSGCMEFFEEPLTAGVVGIYYGDSPYDGYIAFDEPANTCKHSSFTLASRRASLRMWLESEEGPNILGRLAKERVEGSYELFSHFVFPDAITGDEIEPIMRRFMNECLLVLAPGMTVPTPLVNGPIDIIFATPRDTLAKLSHRNEKESAA